MRLCGGGCVTQAFLEEVARDEGDEEEGNADERPIKNPCKRDHREGEGDGDEERDDTDTSTDDSAEKRHNIRKNPHRL